MKDKKIIIAGGTGFIGREIAKYLGIENEIIILTRNIQSPANNAFGDFTLPPAVQKNVKFIYWNGKDIDNWYKCVDGCDIVINLAGKSVNCRYTEKNKKEIFDSRTDATKAIGEAIRKTTTPPKLWINAASATIYRHATDRPQDEYTGEYHNDFSVQVCKLWEKTFAGERTPFTRKIAFRMAITLGPGGVMIPYLHLCKWALGGKQGNGQQMYSWIHIEDVCRAIEFVFANKEMEGVYNLSSPNPVSNKSFMDTLRKTLGCSIGLPAYKWMLRIGAAIIGTEPELILKSRWVLPTKMKEAGFQFKYPLLENAFAEIKTKLPRKAYHLF